MVDIRICPKCKKPALKTANSISGWMAPDLLECRECHYTGRFYIMMDSEDYKLMEEENKPNK